MQKKYLFTDLPTLFFFGRYRKQAIYFFRPKCRNPIIFVNDNVFMLFIYIHPISVALFSK